MFENPDRHGLVIFRDVQSGAGSIHVQVVFDRQENRHFPAEGLADVRNGSLGDCIQVGGYRQVPAELVQLNGFGFAPLDGLSLFAHLDGQLADHQTDRQQSDKRQQVFAIGDRQG